MLARWADDGAYIFRYNRATILAAMLNAVAILIGVVVVIWGAAQRVFTPAEAPALTVLLVALAGIGVNAGSALLFMRSQKQDLNARGAFLHMAADAAVSGAVVLAAVGIMVTGWAWLDATVAIAVSLLIARTAWRLLGDSPRLELDGAPHAIDRRDVAEQLAAQDGVSDVHDPHIWALSTTRTALAAHLAWQKKDADAFIEHLSDRLEHAFGIGHTTVQLEVAPCARTCPEPAMSDRSSADRRSAATRSLTKIWPT